MTVYSNGKRLHRKLLHLRRVLFNHNKHQRLLKQHQPFQLLICLISNQHQIMIILNSLLILRCLVIHMYLIMIILKHLLHRKYLVSHKASLNLSLISLNNQSSLKASQADIQGPTIIIIHRMKVTKSQRVNNRLIMNVTANNHRFLTR